MDPPGKSGVANFTAAMLSHGAGGRTEEQIASQLDFVGATVDMMAGGASTVFQAHALDERLPLTLDILADELARPTFDAAIFPRVMNEIATDIQTTHDDPAAVSNEALMAALYPPENGLHWPVTGTAETLRTITRADLEAFHSRYYRPDLTTVVIVGDIDPIAALSLVQKSFGGWTAVGPAPSVDLPSLQDQLPSARVVTTMPDKTEAVVSMGFRGISRQDPDYYAATLMNLILGSDDFNSRLMRDIRDRRGLVYYVGSGFSAGRVAGPWTLRMESSPNDVDRAITAATEDIRALQARGVTAQEMSLFKRLVAGNQALQLESSAGIADWLVQSELYGLPLDYLWQYPELIGAVTPAQLDATAPRLLHPDNLVVSIAGPYPAAPTAR